MIMAQVVIDKLVTDILKSRKQANKLQNIIEYINLESDPSVMVLASNGAVKVFNHLLKNKEILIGQGSKSLQSTSSIDQFKLWVGGRLTDCYASLFECLLLVNNPNQSLLLSNCMKLLKIKSYVIYLSESDRRTYVFAEKDFRDLIMSVLLSSNEELLHSLMSYIKYDDLRYSMLKNIHVLLLNKTFTEEVSFRHILKIFLIIGTYMTKSICLQRLETSFVLNEDELTEFKQSGCHENPFLGHSHLRMFGKACLEFLKQPLPAYVHKKVLIIAHDCLIPNFAQPRLLSDFLVKTFNMGSGFALLALNGIYVLMTEHNLEYPDFYKNLYSMLHPRIFDAKYKDRFFHLLPMFLASSHISAYLIAAFVKKMSRLCLCAPPNSVLIMLAIIKKMFYFHPNIQHLIDQPDNVKLSLLADDPYSDSELDPAKCNALKSSLWELKVLLSHYSPDVVKAADVSRYDQRHFDDTDELGGSGYIDMIMYTESDHDSNAMNDISSPNLHQNYENLITELWEL